MASNYSTAGDKSLAGLEFRAHMTRSYPDKSLASNVIGFVTQDNTGSFGVEQKYDSLLAGVPQTVWVPLDPNLVGDTPKVPAGTDLILTIDRNIQAMAESELIKGVENSGSAAGTIVVMDPRTGAILALASTPQMDLNDYTNYGSIYHSAAEFDRAVSMQYEPGSVFKILTMATAIDSGLVSPHTSYLDTGFYQIGGVNIFNWDYSAWGPQDMVGCLQHSLNVCMARLADLMGKDTFYTYMRRFGIGHPTGIDLADETSGRLKNPDDSDWYKVDLGTNAFGQGVAVSVIQMMSAASALANDGKMVYPHVLKAMINNGVPYNTPNQSLGTPISAQTARTVTGMLADALEAGNSVALVDGYRIAGKTGTASIPGPLFPGGAAGLKDGGEPAGRMPCSPGGSDAASRHDGPGILGKPRSTAIPWAFRPARECVADRHTLARRESRLHLEDATTGSVVAPTQTEPPAKALSRFLMSIPDFPSRNMLSSVPKWVRVWSIPMAMPMDGASCGLGARIRIRQRFPSSKSGKR